MTTTNASAGTSVKNHHDSLVNATNVVIYASRNLRSKVQAHHKANQRLTDRITFLKILESTVLKEVKEVHTTPAGLEVATQRLIGYQAFTEEDYEYISNLGQKVAHQQVQHLKDALAKLIKQISEVQQFINSTNQSQGTLPVIPSAGSTSSGVSSSGIAAGSSRASSSPSGAGSPQASIAVMVPATVSASSGVTATGSGGANHISNLFLDTMNCLLTNQSINPAFVIKQTDFEKTQQFFDNEGFSLNVSFILSDDDIDALTQSWNAVVAVFADSSNAPSTCTSSFINEPILLESDLFLIHDQLEILYDHLETDVTRKDESILSISI